MSLPDKDSRDDSCPGDAAEDKHLELELERSRVSLRVAIPSSGQLSSSGIKRAFQVVLCQEVLFRRWRSLRASLHISQAVDSPQILVFSGDRETNLFEYKIESRPWTLATLPPKSLPSSVSSMVFSMRLEWRNTRGSRGSQR